MTLFNLFLSAREYLPAFDFEHYPASFKAFVDALAELLPPSDRTAEAVSALLDELEVFLAPLPRRAAKEKRQELRQVLALYAIPAAQKLGLSGEAFADELLAQWNARSPKAPVGKGSYEEIMQGFDANMLNLPKREFKPFRR